MSWRKVKLGDILTESKIISENPNPDRRIKVRLKVLGVEKRGLENEVEGATKQYIRKPDSLFMENKIFIKEHLELFHLNWMDMKVVRTYHLLT